MTTQFVTKPLEVKAVQYTGYNVDEVREILPPNAITHADEEKLVVHHGGERSVIPADHYLVRERGEVFEVWPPLCFRSVFVEKT